MVWIFTPGPNLKSTPKSNPSLEVAFLSSAVLLLKNKLEDAWTPHVSIFGEHMTSCSQFFFGQPKLLFELVQNAWTSRMDTVKQRIPVLLIPYRVLNVSSKHSAAPFATVLGTFWCK
jgi:hypothetical protein